MVTEQPDTAAIRAEIDQANEIAPWTIAWFQMTARDLCDAARAERDIRGLTIAADAVALDRLSARAEAAEARIAAAREILRDAYDRGDFEAIDRALTE